MPPLPVQSRLNPSQHQLLAQYINFGNFRSCPDIGRDSQGCITGLAQISLPKINDILQSLQDFVPEIKLPSLDIDQLFTRLPRPLAGIPAPTFSRSLGTQGLTLPTPSPQATPRPPSTPTQQVRLPETKSAPVISVKPQPESKPKSPSPLVRETPVPRSPASVAEIQALTESQSLRTDFSSFQQSILNKVEALNQGLKNQISNLSSKVNGLSSVSSSQSSSIENQARMITLTQKIDTLDSIQITNGVNIISGGIDITNGNIVLTTGSVTADNLTARSGITVSSATSSLSSLTVTGNTNLATDSGKVGIGTTSPATTLSVTGSTYITAGLGIGIATTTAGALETSGPGLIGGAFNVSGVSSFNASTTLVRAGVTGDSFLGDAGTDFLTLNASTTFANTGGVLGNFFIGDSSTDQLTITSTSTFVSNAGILGSFFIGDVNTDVLTVTATSTFQTGATFANSLAVTGDISVSDDATITGGLGIGVSTTTNGVIETTGAVQIGGALSVTGASTILGSIALGDNSADTLTVTATTTLAGGGTTISAGGLSVTGAGGLSVTSSYNFIGSGTLGDTNGDTLTVNASSTFANSVGFNGNISIGDASGDRVTYNAGLINFTNSATTTISSSALNSFSYATTTTGVPFLTFDTTNYRLGLGTTSPAATLSIGGAGNLYALGGLGVGVATTTSGNIETSGVIVIGGTGTSTFANGIQLTQGCLRGPDGNCAGTLSGTANRLTYFDAANTVSSANFLGVDTTNSRLGIGTTTPGARLSLASLSGTTNADFLLSGINTIYASSSTSTIPTNTLNAFSYATTTTGVPFLTFDTNNYRIGLGTTSPATTLSIGGAGNLYALGGLGVGVATTTSGNLQVSGDIQVQNLTVNGTCTGCGTASGWTDDGTIVRVTTATDIVGIGTSTPRAVLNVAGAAPSLFLTDTNLSASLGGRSFFLLNSNGDFSIGTTSNLFNATSTYLTIASTSRIGIGTTSPSSLFSVQGNALVSGTTTAGGFEATSTVRSKHIVISGTLNVESGGSIVGAGAAGKVTNLDADLLDGQDSSAFGDATAANQTTILNRIGVSTDATSTASLFAKLNWLADQVATSSAKTSSLLGLSAFGGDGSWGNVTISSASTTPSTINQFNNLTLSAAYTSSDSGPAGIFIAVRESLTINTNGSISVNGKGQSGGPADTSGTDCVGNISAGAVTICASGSGGAGGNSGAGAGFGKGGGAGGTGGASNGSAAVATSNLKLTTAKLNKINTLSSYNLSTSSSLLIVGAGGGGGGSATPVGGAGGAGGGVIYIEASNIVINPTSAVITANGSNGSDGSQSGCAGGATSGGGGGGGGGIVWIRALTTTGVNETTVTANAGSGGVAGAGGGGCGTGGTNGAAGAKGLILIEKVVR